MRKFFSKNHRHSGRTRSEMMTAELALQTGRLLGTFYRHGIEARPIVDDGNYTTGIIVTLPSDFLGESEEVTIEVKG